MQTEDVEMVIKHDNQNTLHCSTKYNAVGNTFYMKSYSAISSTDRMKGKCILKMKDVD